MKYLIGVMFGIALITCLLVGCSHYRSTSAVVEVSDRSFIKEIDSGESFEIADDSNDVYHVKYVHIVL
jgi:hypothetical protein